MFNDEEREFFSGHSSSVEDNTMSQVSQYWYIVNSSFLNIIILW